MDFSPDKKLITENLKSQYAQKNKITTMESYEMKKNGIDQFSKIIAQQRNENPAPQSQEEEDEDDEEVYEEIIVEEDEDSDDDNGGKRDVDMDAVIEDGEDEVGDMIDIMK